MSIVVLFGLFCFKTKFQAITLIQHFILIENQFNTTEKTVKTRNGLEFAMSTFYKGLITKLVVLKHHNTMEELQ